jgi:YD repeat-containing protein
VTDGRGVTTTFTQDDYGNPTTTQIGAHQAVTYQYNAVGLMTSLIDRVG